MSRHVPCRIAIAMSAMGGCSLEQALNADTAQTTSADDGSSGGAATLAPGSEAADDTAAPSPECTGKRVRVSTHNVQSIGAVGSVQHEALGSIVLRVAADVACFQEVQDYENASLNALAGAVGYAHVVQADASPAIGGDHTNACIATVPLERVGSWGGRDLSSESDANDVGRDILVVRAHVGQPDGDDCHVGAFVLHLKSGQEPVDWFRRQVEIERTVQAIARYRESYPYDPMVVVGDFNEQPDDPALGHVFANVPTGLPSSYDLGEDIVLPLVYQPFASLQDQGLALAQPTQEDSTTLFATWGDAIRLDYLWFFGAALVQDEVYNSCRDDGVDEDPPGDVLDKAGDPLPCGVSRDASDHLPVVADLQLD